MGIVWLDAHSDVQTLETSGYLGGLPRRPLPRPVSTAVQPVVPLADIYPKRAGRSAAEFASAMTPANAPGRPSGTGCGLIPAAGPAGPASRIDQANRVRPGAGVMPQADSCCRSAAGARRPRAGISSAPRTAEVVSISVTYAVSLVVMATRAGVEYELMTSRASFSV